MRIGTATEESENDQRTCLWIMVSGGDQLTGFYYFRFQFHEAKTQRDWRSFSAFSAFIVALFVEMYGFPSDDLSALRLAGAPLSRSGSILSHDAGHLWNTLLGWKVNPHFDPLHILSNVVILCGFILLSAAWKVLYEAQRTRTLAVTGPYAYVRHPQYDGFILIMLGFLLQWPTLVTLIMFPILVFDVTPAFFPRLRAPRRRQEA